MRAWKKKQPNNNNINIKALHNWSGSGVCGSEATRHALKSETGWPGAGAWLWGSSCHDSIRPSRLKGWTPTCPRSSRFAAASNNWAAFHSTHTRQYLEDDWTTGSIIYFFFFVCFFPPLSFVPRDYKRTRGKRAGRNTHSDSNRDNDDLVLCRFNFPVGHPVREALGA